MPKKRSSLLFSVSAVLMIALGVQAAPRSDQPREPGPVQRIVRIVKKFINVATGGEISVPKP